MTEDELRGIEADANTNATTVAWRVLALVKEIRALRARAECAERIANDLADDLHVKDSYKTGVADEWASVGVWLSAYTEVWPSAVKAITKAWVADEGRGVVRPPATLIARVIELEGVVRRFVEAFPWMNNETDHDASAVEVTLTAHSEKFPLNMDMLTLSDLRRARDVLERKEVM